jgi:hypothetical protein
MALYAIDDPEVLAFMRDHMSEKRTETAYYCTNYVAKTGDVEALGILYANFWAYPVMSLQWATTVRLFGVHKYMNAVPKLIETMDAASGNVGQAAYEALSEIFGIHLSGPFEIQWAQAVFRQAYREYLAEMAGEPR